MADMPDMSVLLQQAQQLQAKMLEAQEQAKSRTVEASAGGGMVKVVMGGQKQLLELKLDPEVVSKDDVEMLQDLVLAAVNEAGRKVDEAVQEKLGGLTGGLKIPGL